MQTVDGDEQVVEDTAQRTYLLRTLQQVTPLTDDGERCRSAVHAGQVQGVRIRFDSLEFEGIPDDIWAFWHLMGGMIRVKHQPPGAISF